MTERRRRMIQAMTIRGSHEQQNRFRGVAHLALGQARLVVFDQRDDVPARDVVEVHDREAVAAQFMTDRQDLATGNRRADGSAVEHPGKREIVHIPSRSGDLGGAFLARNLLPDGCHDEDSRLYIRPDRANRVVRARRRPT